MWRGVGSTDPERQAALQYAKSIARESEVVELTQGENDDNDMFWMVLGDEAFAEADYWKWRRAADYDIQPSAWRVDSSKRAHMLSHVEFWSDEANPAQSVYIINCIWELFVLVGSNARGKRQDIRLAFETAKVSQPAHPTPYIDCSQYGRDTRRPFPPSGRIPLMSMFLSSLHRYPWI